MSERNSQVHPVIRGIINRVSAQVMEEPLFADSQVIHTAIMDVIGSGDPTFSNGHVPTPWPLWHEFPDVANEARERFCDAVKDRIRVLQAPPFNLGIKLENYCGYHIRQRLGLPESQRVICADGGKQDCGDG